MPPLPEDKPMGSLEVMRRGAGLAQLMLHIAATTYRLVFYAPGTMGGRAIGLVNGIGALLAYGAVVTLAPPASPAGLSLAMWGWQALYLMLVVQFVASKFGGAHSFHIGKSYFDSPLIEAAFALGVAFLASPLCEGVAYAVAGGWAASELQVLLIKVRVRRSAALVKDTRFEAEQLQDYIEE